MWGFKMSINVVYTGSDTAAMTKAIEKRIVAMYKALPYGTTVTEEGSKLIITAPDGFISRLSSSNWTAFPAETKMAKRIRKESAVSVREAEAERPNLPPPIHTTDKLTGSCLPDYIKDHLEVVIVRDKPKETVKGPVVPVVPAALSIPIPTRREATHNEVRGIKGISVTDSPYCVWVGGNTYPVRDRIKAQGFKWSPNKKQWYKDVSEEVIA